MVMRLLLSVCLLFVVIDPASGQSKGDRTSSPPTGRSTQGPQVRPVARTQDQDAQAPPSGEGRVQLKNERLNQDPQPMDPVLADLLVQWSKASSHFNRLEGQHTRLTYDTIFETEKQAEGRFYYEKVDKGRIEIEPVEITKKLIADRDAEVAAATNEQRRSGVRLNKEGKQFKLVPEQQELWCCDGQRVYSLDVTKKQAQVHQLPAEMQGVNIMDSPLPFLFGMPPEVAQRRFRMKFSAPFDHTSGHAYLEILPRLQMDADSWQKANVILNLDTFLPTAVQLLDPAGTKITVFKFRNIKVNQSSFVSLLKGVNPRTIFTPDLRDYNILTAPVETAAGDSAEPQLVNVTTRNYKDAILELERQGFVRRESKDPANTIILEQGPPAPKGQEPFTVKSQSPEPGTPLQPGMKVRLVIWDDPSRTAQKQ
jgi:TIGR03009 family protein